MRLELKKFRLLEEIITRGSRERQIGGDLTPGGRSPRRKWRKEKDEYTPAMRREASSVTGDPLIPRPTHL